MTARFPDLEAVGNSLARLDGAATPFGELSAIVNTLWSHARVDLTDDQYAALASIAIDVGIDTIAVSQLVRKAARGDANGALWEFTRWADRGGGPDRRTAEAELFAS